MAPGPRGPESAARETERSERELGKLTFQGAYSYKPEGASPSAARARVTVAGALDCEAGTGSLYYRDAPARVEWQSSRFAFDATTVCFADRGQLDALTTAFDATISGTYSPVTADEDA